MIMPEHDSRYYAKDLSEIKDQSYTYMLKWANRWRTGIFHSMKRYKNRSEGNTVRLWKIWHPEMKDAPITTVNQSRAKELTRKEEKKKPKLKSNPITNVFRVTKKSKSTSKAAKPYEKRKWENGDIRDYPGGMEEPKSWHQFEDQMIDDRYEDGFHK